MSKINLKTGILDALGEDAANFIPFVTDNSELHDCEIPDTMPILPLRNTVLFPGVIMPINIGRTKSLRLIQEAYKNGDMIGCIAQKSTSTEDPQFNDLYQVGTVAFIVKILEMADGTTSVILQGKRRFVLEDILYSDPFHVGKIMVKPEASIPEGDEEYIAIAESLKEAATKLVRYSNNLPQEARVALKNTESMLFLINFISANSDIDYQSKQELLEIDDVKERAIKLLELMGKQISLLELKNDIQKKVKNDIDKQQREYFLHQQMKTIQDELGGNPTDEEFKELEDRAAQKEWDENVKKIFYKELDKLKRLNPQSPDYSVQSNYLHEMLELPWNHCSEDNLDLEHAKEMLDADHFGLEKVKDRILEYLAVLKLKADMKSPILCLYGPPGVGKTSLGKSVAKAINREFVRMSLGGLHDEAEIRGHRKTYIGAMPGRIITALQQAGSRNPLILLDEKTTFTPLSLNLELPTVGQGGFMALGLFEDEEGGEGYLDNKGKVSGYRYSDEKGTEVIVDTFVQKVTIGSVLIDKNGTIVGLSHISKQESDDSDLFLPISTAINSVGLDICGQIAKAPKVPMAVIKPVSTAIDGFTGSKEPKPMSAKGRK